MSDETKDKLVVTGKLGPTKVGLGAALEKAKNAGKLAEDTVVNFAGYPNRIVLCVDDSGSMSADMGSGKDRMTAAREAAEGFLSVCNSGDTVVGMYTISTDVEISLNWDYKQLLVAIKELHHYGGTPTFHILNNLFSKENVTRVVLISDGTSNEGFAINNDSYKDTTPSKNILDKFKEKKVSIDTVFIGTENDTAGIREMKDIAEYTGGLFIHFKDAKDFASKFKYLAPAFYGLLVSGEIKL